MSLHILTYLKIGNISYLMTESQVIAILGKPKEETENLVILFLVVIIL